MTGEQATDEMIRAIENRTGFICPKDSKRNHYTKICWLIGIHQRALHYGVCDEHIKAFVRQATEMLPGLRERMAKK